MCVPTIGILGGIGSGKSSVVRQVTDLHLQIIDADRIGHDLLADPDVLRQLRHSFPASVFDVDGQVIRSELAKLVFGETDEHRTALKNLEHILHPAIHREIRARIRSAGPEVDAIILDAAILLETGWAEECDFLIFIDTPEEQRIERVRTNRGWSAGELQRREAAQLPVTTKKERAGYVVDNSGTLQEAVAQMTKILHTITAS